MLTARKPTTLKLEEASAMFKKGYLLVSFAAFLLGALSMGVLVIVKTPGNSHSDKGWPVESVESILAGSTVHIMESIELSDPTIKDGRMEKTYRYGRNLIVGPTAKGIIDLTHDGQLVYWGDQDNKLFCSLVRSGQVVAEVKIPLGWLNYNGSDLVRDFRKALILTPLT